MRQLMVKQKKYLNKLTADRDILSVDDLTADEWNTLKEMNDTEILWQEVNHYLWDKR